MAARDSWKAESVRVFADQIVRASTALESQSKRKEKNQPIVQTMLTARAHNNNTAAGGRARHV